MTRKLLKLAHERQVRIDVAVPAADFHDPLGFVLALFLFQRVHVVAEDRIVERGDELLVVVIVAEIAVAVRVGPDPDLRFPEAVRRAVLAHLADRDLAGAVGEDVVALLLRRVDRRAVREPRMRGVAEVFEIEFPVAVIGMLEDAAGDFELAVGRAIDHVVERRRHVAEPVFERWPLGGLIDENKAAIARHARHMQHRHGRAFRIEARRIAVLQRHSFQAAVEMIGPAVIAALEFVGPAFVERHHDARRGGRTGCAERAALRPGRAPPRPACVRDRCRNSRRDVLTWLSWPT